MTTIPISQLRDAIADRASDHGYQSCPAHFYVSGSTDIETPIPLYPGLRITGEGTWSGMGTLRCHDCAGFAWPKALKQGGGGGGVAYPHHTTLRCLRVESADPNGGHPAFDIYNGGWRCGVDDVAVVDMGAGVKIERTAHNITVSNMDCRGVEMPIMADLHDATQGILIVGGNNQFDGCGHSEIIVGQGGLPYGLMLIKVGGIKAEWTPGNWSGELPPCVVEFTIRTTAVNRIWIEGITAHPWIDSSTMRAVIIQRLGRDDAARQRFFGLSTIAKWTRAHPDHPPGIPRTIDTIPYGAL